MSDQAPTPPSRDPAPGPPPGLGRVALLTGGLLLVVAGSRIRPAYPPLEVTER